MKRKTVGKTTLNKIARKVGKETKAKLDKLKRGGKTKLSSDKAFKTWYSAINKLRKELLKALKSKKKLVVDMMTETNLDTRGGASVRFYVDFADGVSERYSFYLKPNGEIKVRSR